MHEYSVIFSVQKKYPFFNKKIIPPFFGKKSFSPERENYLKYTARKLTENDNFYVETFFLSNFKFPRYLHLKKKQHFLKYCFQKSEKIHIECPLLVL